MQAIGIPDRPGAAVSPVRVFVSHSSKDAVVAKLLADLLKEALGLAPNQIRCTSVDGYRLPVGVDVDRQLRLEILGAETLIGLISSDSIHSCYVMFEIGARWGIEKHLAPLLVPGADPRILQGPITRFNVLRCDRVPEMEQFVEDLGRLLGCSPPAPSSYWEHVYRLQSFSRRSVFRMFRM